MLVNILILAGSSLAIAILALYVTAVLLGPGDRVNRLKLQSTDGETAFLFDDEMLVDATPEARAIIDSTPPMGTDWSRLLSAFIPQFPDLRTKIKTLADEGKLELESRNGQSFLHCEWRKGLVRISLTREGASETGGSDVDRHVFQAMEQELITLRATSDNGPLLVWREHTDGTVTWANAAYLAMADSFDPTNEIQSWPPRRLFPDPDPAEVFALDHTPDEDKLNANEGAIHSAQTTARQSILHPEGDIHWFDVYRAKRDDGTLFTAVPADHAVKAETTLRDFSSTLTNTFSHLSVGLVVFSRERRVALYNPALLALTEVQAGFLDRKPTLFEFLDKLRDIRMMPEPKNYANWRMNISQLEAQAEDGTFEEVWPLPMERTYRVTGKPHADGAIAFFFEDITSEVTLSRRFRSEIETGQAVLDCLDDAMAVFANDGRMIMSNTAYNTLWGLGDMEPLIEPDVETATRMWHSKCAPTAIWSDIKDVLKGEYGEAEWQGVARLWDGRRLSCFVSPLPGGQTLARFTPDKVATTTPRTAPAQVDPEYLKM